MARRFVENTLATWDGAHDHDATVLMAGELVTNAIVHARSPAVLTIRYEEPVVTVEVQDDSVDVPADLLASSMDEHGRGVHLVAKMADSWGVRQIRGTGKVVWFSVMAR
jgi:two-component sensor histidine kinase